MLADFKKNVKKKISSNNEFKPAWGKHVPKAQQEIDDADRIKAKRKLNLDLVLYPVDPEKLPLRILERKVEFKEG